jgi:hypothetical protein
MYARSPWCLKCSCLYFLDFHSYYIATHAWPIKNDHENHFSLPFLYPSHYLLLPFLLYCFPIHFICLSCHSSPPSFCLLLHVKTSLTPILLFYSYLHLLPAFSHILFPYPLFVQLINLPLSTEDTRFSPVSLQWLKILHIFSTSFMCIFQFIQKCKSKLINHKHLIPLLYQVSI